MSAGLRISDDRGLHYGDGLFETMRYAGTKAPLWDWHRQRLAHGCSRLGLPEPKWGALQRRLARAAGTHAQSTVKLIWTAGSAPRGYARPETISPRALIQALAWQPEASRLLRLRWCATRLALQPALAGLKHLNRLEQVLARAEWHDADFDEGLMLDMQGRVVAATSANVLIREHGRWYTPALERCGVAGVARRWLMAQTVVTECELSPAQLLSAEVVMLSSALRGPRQVGSLQDRHWPVDDQVLTLQSIWEQQYATPAERT